MSTDVVQSFYCEVLETTENLERKKLLAGGGGLFSSEGFPQPKHVTSRSSAWAMPKPV
jgi:hypothetical protein